jgi:hypothetical protein
LHNQKSPLSLQAQNQKIMTKKPSYIFRVTVEDWTSKQKIHYEANLIAVIEFIDKHATRTLTVGEINKAIHEGETLRLTNDHTATIKLIGHDTPKAI